MLDALGNGALVFLVGLLVVFAGILVLVLSITLVGKIITKFKIGETTTTTETVTETVTEVEEAVVVEESDGIPAEIKVAIIAAVTSYYFAENKSKCDFVVKKIRRI